MVHTCTKAKTSVQGSDDIHFVHGTSLTFAYDISEHGLSERAILSLGRGSTRPGHFFPFLVGPPPHPGPGLQLAYELSLRWPPPRAVLVGSLPQGVFEALERIGLVETLALSGAPIGETVWSPGAFSTIDSYNLSRWQMLQFP
jgi:hypothetical protein